MNRPYCSWQGRKIISGKIFDYQGFNQTCNIQKCARSTDECEFPRSLPVTYFLKVLRDLQHKVAHLKLVRTVLGTCETEDDDNTLFSTYLGMGFKRQAACGKAPGFPRLRVTLVMFVSSHLRLTFSGRPLFRWSM